jgi:hypothetical protein
MVLNKSADDGFRFAHGFFGRRRFNQSNVNPPPRNSRLQIRLGQVLE